MNRTTDVVVVGASIAGCTTARLLAQQGAEVTLVEKRPDLDAYKVVCTHYIQASALPAIRRLGLDGPLEEAGANHATVDLWTRYGWITWQNPDYHGYNIRRQTLDPLLRRMTVETPGVDFRPGRTVTGVVEDAGRVRGVTVSGRGGESETIEARLVVAADGRESRMAQLARVPARRRPHNRFGYFSYFEDVELRRGGRAQIWFLEPDIAYLFPGEEGVVCVAGFFTGKERLPEVRKDPDAAMRALYGGLPDAPDPWSGKQISKWLGKVELENLRRPAAARGMAFVGDAAQASDPVWGVGCGFAFQSADWLAEEVSGAIHGSDEGLDHALERYARRHRRELAGHHFVMSDFASGRPMTPVEKLLFSTAAIDDDFAAWFERFGSRDVRAETFLPQAVARAAAVRARRLVAA